MTLYGLYKVKRRYKFGTLFDNRHRTIENIKITIQPSTLNNTAQSNEIQKAEIQPIELKKRTKRKGWTLATENGAGATCPQVTFGGPVGGLFTEGGSRRGGNRAPGAGLPW